MEESKCVYYDRFKEVLCGVPSSDIDFHFQVCLDSYTNPEEKDYFITRIWIPALMKRLQSWTTQYPAFQPLIDFLQDRISNTNRLIMRFRYAWGQQLFHLAAFDNELALVIYQGVRIYPDHLPKEKYISEEDYEWISRDNGCGPRSPLVDNVPFALNDFFEMINSLTEDGKKYTTFTDFVPLANNPFVTPTHGDRHIGQEEINIKTTSHNIFSVIGHFYPDEWTCFLRDLDSRFLRDIWGYIQIHILCVPLYHDPYRSLVENIEATRYHIDYVKKQRQKGLMMHPYTKEDVYRFVVTEFSQVYQKKGYPLKLARFFQKRKEELE
jgi:hypothetical protein